MHMQQHVEALAERRIEREAVICIFMLRSGWFVKEISRWSLVASRQFRAIFRRLATSH